MLMPDATGGLHWQVWICMSVTLHLSVTVTHKNLVVIFCSFQSNDWLMVGLVNEASTWRNFADDVDPSSCKEPSAPISFQKPIFAGENNPAKLHCSMLASDDANPS